MRSIFVTFIFCISSLHSMQRLAKPLYFAASKNFNIKSKRIFCSDQNNNFLKLKESIKNFEPVDKKIVASLSNDNAAALLQLVRTQQESLYNKIEDQKKARWQCLGKNIAAAGAFCCLGPSACVGVSMLFLSMALSDDNLLFTLTIAPASLLCFASIAGPIFATCSLITPPENYRGQITALRDKQIKLREIEKSFIKD